MKINYPQLQAHLGKKTLAPIYLVCGEELLLKQEACAAISAAAIKAGFTERERYIIDSSLEQEYLYTLLHSPSLLGEKRRIELDIRHGSPNKILTTILTEYLKDPSPANILLLDMGKVDAKSAKTPWYQTIEKIGIVVTIWPIANEQVPQWILQRAQQRQIPLTSDAAHLICDYTEGNLTAASQVLEKIALLAPTKLLDRENLKLLLADETRFSMFDFVENVIAGNISRSLQILNHLKLEGVEPPLILWALTREIRLLADLASKLKAGAALSGLLQKQRIFFNRQTAFKHFLQKFSAEDCWHILNHAAEMDQIIKGGSPGNIWESLQRLTLKLI